MEWRLALLSTIFSPDLQRITLVFDIFYLLRRDKICVKLLASEGWGALEEILLQLAARSRGVIEVLIYLLTGNPSSTGPECGTLMSRFKEVGKVTVAFA